jgi:lysozyme
VADLARGIDVSNYAGQFDWAATSGLSFGICRASQGLGAPGTNSPDPYLAWNWPRIKAKGLARGAYHFLDPGLNGAAQARYFVQTVRAVGLANTDMLWLDNETAGGSAGSVAACARDFMSTLVSLRPHNPCGVYSYWSFITSGNCAGLERYPLWLAIFQSATPGAPAPWRVWKFWQSGQTSSYDDDVFNGSAAQLTRWIRSYQAEVEVQSGQLNTGANAVTVITVPAGSGSNIAFGCDNGIQGLPPASLRVAIYDTQWHVNDTVTVSSTSGQAVIPFPNAAKTGVISVKRQDAGEVVVGYEVSLEVLEHQRGLKDAPGTLNRR